MARASLFILGLLIGSVGSFGGLMLQPWSLFILRNESAETMRLTVNSSARTVWAGDLPAGGVQAALSIIDRDTGIRVTCETAGSGPVTIEGGYLTTGPPSVVKIRMKSCSDPRYETRMLP